MSFPWKVFSLHPVCMKSVRHYNRRELGVNCVHGSHLSTLRHFNVIN